MVMPRHFPLFEGVYVVFSRPSIFYQQIVSELYGLYHTG